MSLFAVTVVCASGAAFLSISTAASRRQTQEVDNLRAFYVAEAGLAEAFHAVRIGRSGDIGTSEEPALFGDGLLWVTATDLDDNQVRLESTALVGTGRASLAYVIEPEEVPLGFFSDEDLVVDSVLMVDGFDSTEATYEEEIGLGQVTVDPDDPFLFVDEGEKLLFFDGVFYRFSTYEGTTFYYDASLNWIEFTEDPTVGLALPPEQLDKYLDKIEEHLEDLNPDDFYDEVYYDGDGYGDGGDFSDVEYDVVKEYFKALPVASAAAGGGITAPAGAQLPEGPTTGEGALFCSNGDVVFAAPEGDAVAIYGDVVPGPEGTVEGLQDAFVSGETEPRNQAIELPPVEVPALVLNAPTRHEGLLPLVVAPGQIGYERLEVAADAELIVRGPAILVVDELVLEPGAAMTLDTRDGNVELYVTAGLDLQPGSLVTTTSDYSDELSIQVSAAASVDGEAPVKLEATSQFHGTLYAPSTEVYVGPDFEVYGSIVAHKLELGPGARLHFDTVDYDSSIPEIVAWRIVEIPSEIRMSRANPYLLLGVAPGDPSPLADAHDLADVTLDIEYIDHGGASLTYFGSEAGFDWSAVATVIDIERDAVRAAADDGDIASPADPDLDDPESPVEPENTVRTEVQGLCDLTASTGFFASGDIFVGIMEGYVPLTQAEWQAIDDIPGDMSPENRQRLIDADVAAGGPGGQ